MITTRFAPSPTGYLHIGGLRTALYSYLWARKNSGKFLLRIEDTDLERNSKEAAKAIEKAFDWVGLEYDGDVVYQSSRFPLYKEYIQKLLDEGKAYKCYMTKDELEKLRKEQRANKERPRYDGRYRDFKGTPPKGVEPVIRIKAPLNGEIVIDDGIKGEVKFNVEDMLDDFIIARSDGTPTYNFVVAVDDATMGVTDVIRGDDHLSNTPKQVVIYEALGFEVPKFYHVPMILNPQGKKLSKRDGAMDVMEYKKEGILPEALLNFLVRLGWSHGDREIFSLEEMIELFDPKDINSSASAYNQEKLLWINSHYIKSLSVERLVEELKFFDLDLSENSKSELLVDLHRDRARTIKEMAGMIKSIINEPTSYDEKAYKKFINDKTIENLEGYLSVLKTEIELKNSDDFEKITKEYMAQKGLKLKDLAPALRVAIVGSAVSPAIFGVLSIVGRDETVARIERLLKYKGEN